jgi:aspartyl-tRNA(Asn)/glutamyl-tRNA(Gln) amidotransferase subunit A
VPTRAESASSEIAYLSAATLRELYAKRVLSPVEVTSNLLERAEALNPELQAFVTITPEVALAQARRAEATFKSGTEGAGILAGVPITLKDLTPTAGIRTTFGSLLFEDWVPDFDSPVAERLAAAGAVLLGKTTTPEFGWKGDSGNRVNGPARNPWNTSLTAGGSSGGAGAAVAAGIGPIAQGTDGAGSIRIPASLCGVFGFKPSFGLIPSYPPPASGMGHVGPLTRTVLDAALFLDATAGPDSRDRFSLNRTSVLFAKLDASIEGVRVGWTADLGYGNDEPEVVEVAKSALSALAEAGSVVEEIALELDDPLPAVEIIWTTAQAAIHRTDLEVVRDRLDPGRLTVIERGLQFTGAELAGARLDADAFSEKLRGLFDRYDVLALPTLPVTAFAAGADHPSTVNGRQATVLSWLQLVYPFNLTTQPAASVPAGFTRAGMPVGVQIVGAWRDDQLVMRAAAEIERRRPWKSRVAFTHAQ